MRRQLTRNNRPSRRPNNPNSAYQSWTPEQRKQHAAFNRKYDRPAIHFPKGQLDRVERLADLKGMSRSAAVRLCCNDYIQYNYPDIYNSTDTNVIR